VKRHHLEEIFGVAQEQIVRVAVMCVKRGTTDLGAVEYVLHADLGKRLLVNERHQSSAQGVARPENTSLIQMASRSSAWWLSKWKRSTPI
jgi:hypothetical protein